MSTPQSTNDNQSLPFAGILPGSPKPFYLANGEGEKSVVFDQLFTIMLSGDETDGQYGVFAVEAPKGDMIPPHLHQTAHEIFYVVDGSITVWMDDQQGFQGKRTLKTGDFGFVPTNTVHAFRMEAPTKVRDLRRDLARLTLDGGAGHHADRDSPGGAAGTLGRALDS